MAYIVGDCVKTNVVYKKNEDEEESGICVIQGMVSGGAARWLPAGMPFCRGHGKHVLLTAMCRKNSSDPEAGTLMREFLRRLCDWFEEELPGILSHFSFEIVKCYWRRIIWDFYNTWQIECPFDFAVFLFYRGKYLFCGNGDIHIYEYRCSGKTYKRWYTVRERRIFAGELGESDDQGVLFQIRNISEHCLFLLCPDEIQPGNPQKYKSKKKREQFVIRQCEKTSAVLLVECRQEKIREGRENGEL